MLNVYATFHSISGEIGHVPQGTQMFFIRLAGCNLRCFFCDTKVTQDGNNGTQTSFDELKGKIIENSIENIMITGGEPLLQEADISNFIEYTMDDLKNFKFHIETNGTIFPSYFIRQTCGIVYDYKMSLSNRMIDPEWYDADLYRYRPYLKFLVGDFSELLNAIQKMKYIESVCRNPPVFAVSSYNKLIEAKHIFRVLKEKHCDAIINVQLHKILGLD